MFVAEETPSCPFEQLLNSPAPPVELEPLGFLCTPTGTGTGAAKADAGTLSALVEAVNTCTICAVGQVAVGKSRGSLTVADVMVTGSGIFSPEVYLNIQVKGGLSPVLGASSVILGAFVNGEAQNGLITVTNGVVLQKDGHFSPSLSPV